MGYLEMMKKLPIERPKREKQFAGRIEQSTWDELTKISIIEDRSVSSIIRLALAKFVDDYNQPKPEPGGSVASGGRRVSQ